MDLNRFTEKAQEAVASARQLAVQFGQQQIDVEHVFLALLEQQDGLAAKVLVKAGASSTVFRSASVVSSKSCRASATCRPTRSTSRRGWNGCSGGPRKRPSACKTNSCPPTRWSSP